MKVLHTSLSTQVERFILQRALFHPGASEAPYSGRRIGLCTLSSIWQPNTTGKVYRKYFGPFDDAIRITKSNIFQQSHATKNDRLRQYLYWFFGFPLLCRSYTPQTDITASDGDGQVDLGPENGEKEVEGGEEAREGGGEAEGEGETEVTSQPEENPTEETADEEKGKDTQTLCSRLHIARTVHTLCRPLTIPA
jgi:hypothetical protein